MVFRKVLFFPFFYCIGYACVISNRNCCLSFFFVLFSRLIQENDFGKDQNSNIIVAMTFYELWYSTIPKELLRTESDRVSTPSRSYDRPTYSKGCDRSNNTEAGTGFECDSDSVQNDKILATNFDGGSNRDNSVVLKTENISQNDQPQGFYVNSGENTGPETSLSNLANKLPYASLSVLGEFSILLSFCLYMEEMKFCFRI